MNNPDERDTDAILYELLEYFVKKQEPELIRCKNDNVILPNSGTIKNAIRYLNNSYSLPECISKQISLTLPWKFAIGDNGKILAILQENVIEIRRLKDEFSSVVGKASVPRDAFVRWRKMCWSPDGSILVLGSSNGYLSFYNSLGNNIFNINPKTLPQNPEILEAGDAISSLIFNSIKSNDNKKWTYEFITVTYSGLLKSYKISNNNYQFNYEFSFGNFYGKGVNSFAYDKKHNLYIIAGNKITQNILSTASNMGLTSWRCINDFPYYKLSFTFDDSVGSNGFSLWNFIPSFKKNDESVIFKISVSPNCNYLACLHTDGSISLWNLPNLQLRKKWSLNEQPDFNANSNSNSNTSKRRKFPLGFSEFHPLNIGWWCDNSIIIARYSGAISVCSINDLKNLLGTSPEFLNGQPEISDLYLGKGFLCLDCEITITSKKRSREANSDGQISEASDSEKEEDELEPLSFMNYMTNVVRSILFSITDIESFQPKRKKTKILHRTYKLLGLKSTTPEELYSRKIDIEQYEEALNLANKYNLDTDLVYQTQWRKSQFSSNAIRDHLSKVRKRSWVLNECIMRVPETFKAAKELLDFGLKGANLKTFLSIDDKLAEIDELDGELDELDDITINLPHMKTVNQILQKIDLSHLSDSEKELLFYRRRLLNHLDKLKTYEIIIQDPKNFDKTSYEKFRQSSIIENAVKFARDCNYRAVEIMFTYHGQKLMPHWLAIINCFPETLNPTEYKKLLPKCDELEQLFLLDQQEMRPKDWSEKSEFDNLIDANEDDHSQFIYELEPSLSIYKNTELTMELLRKWYKSRAYQIERNSCLVENALELIKIARSYNIKGLEDFLLELETLDDLVYKIHLENMSLAQLEKLSDIEKVKLLMSSSSEKDFVSNLKSFVFPFIYRKQKYLGGSLDKKLLMNFLVLLSEEDLTLPLKFFESIKHDLDILNMVEDLLTLALDCIYSCNSFDVYHKAKSIFDTLPKTQSTKDSPKTDDPMESLQKELECLKILNKHKVQSTVKFIHENKNNLEDVKTLLNQMARSLIGVQPIPSQELWNELLNDMLDLQEFIFLCLSTEECFEICVINRLASGVKSTILNCTSLIETKRNEASLLKVSYQKAVELILEACKEYFNTSKSLDDSNMELARACLNLIQDDNALIQEEYDLINSLQILDEFGINILPFQIRLMQDKLKLIENCLHQRHDAYKKQHRLLTLAAYLHIDVNNPRSRESKVLELIAHKAFEADDFDACSSTCQKLIENNYFSAWTIIQRLGICSEFNDFHFRQKCLSFALTYGPTSILEDTLKHMNLLEIQLLNKNLESWMSNQNLDSLMEDINAESDEDDDFTDAMTTPQVEVKEFVPKILETSTGLVKTSAQLVKQSTWGILKNVSNQNFWKAALNISNRSDSNEKESDDLSDGNENRENRQSFPYFYSSLHENCAISRLDANYDRFSPPEIANVKLKIFQTLLRVSALSETACYGLEVSDISHFLIQLSANTFADDWLLALGYLLNLKNPLDAEEVFRILPKTDLYLETGAYYYSLELYKQMNPGKINYLINPMDLIQGMFIRAKNETDDNIKQLLVSRYQQLVLGKTVEGIEQVNDSNQSDINDLECKNDSTDASVANESDVVDLDQNGDDLADENGLGDANVADENDKFIDSVLDNDVNSKDDTLKQNLYENDAFKIAPDIVDDETSGWDDNWSDFSDKNNDEIDQKHSESLSECLLVESSSNKLDLNSCSVDDEDLLNSACQISSSNDNDNGLINHYHDYFDVNDETKRYEIFKDCYSQMISKDDYYQLKELINKWPAFTDPQFLTIDKHPILLLIKSLNKILPRDNNNELIVLDEYKNLLQKQLIDDDILIAFINDFDELSTINDKLFLRLYSNNSNLHNEAINLIKNNDSNINLPLIILELIFFKNLTLSFPPHHPIYDKIITEMFLNHKLIDIKPQIELLINKLIELKHLPYAIALWNQLSDIPTALSTFESCFQTFLLKK